MKYWSESLKKLFDTEKALIEAEKAVERKNLEAEAREKEKAKDKAEVTKKIDEVTELISKYIMKYGDFSILSYYPDTPKRVPRKNAEIFNNENKENIEEFIKILNGFL